MSKKITNLRDGIRKRMGEPPGFLAEMLEQKPLRSSMIRLHLDQIQRYERNPRKFGNPEYEAIKESIRQRGLDQPLHVTQRPGENHYTLKKGAGTRLQALEELWQETDDRKYFEQECVFEPYKDELDLFVGHGIENLKRSQMSFIETAFFYMELRQLHEDIEGRELSTREACERINADGFSVDQSRLVRYRYGVQLYQWIPKALEGGLSQRGIEQVRQQERAYRTLWERHNGRPELFESIWQTALSACDHDEGIDIARLQGHTEQHMAQELNLNLRHLTAEVDLLFGQPDPDDLQALTPTLLAPPSRPTPQPPVSLPGSSEDLSGASDAISGIPSTRTPQPAPAATTKSLTPKRQPAEPPAPVTTPEAPPPTLAVDERTFGTAEFAAEPSPRSSLIGLRFPDAHGDIDRIVVEYDQFIARPHGHDGQPLFQASKAAAGWVCAILQSFEGVMFRSPDGVIREPVGLSEGYEPGCYRMEVWPPTHELKGHYLFDYVWWRVWKIIEAPYLEEMADPTSRIAHAIHNIFDSSSTMNTMEIRSPWLFSDPAYEWIDWPLQQLERAIREFHQQRRRISDRNINPLGVQF